MTSNTMNTFNEAPGQIPPQPIEPLPDQLSPPVIAEPHLGSPDPLFGIESLPAHVQDADHDHDPDHVQDPSARLHSVHSDPLLAAIAAYPMAEANRRAGAIPVELLPVPDMDGEELGFEEEPTMDPENLADLMFAMPRPDSHAFESADGLGDDAVVQRLVDAAPSTAAQTLSEWKKKSLAPVSERTAAFYYRCVVTVATEAGRNWNADPHYEASPEDIAYLAVGQAAEMMLASGIRSDPTKRTYRAALLWACANPDVIRPGPEVDRAVALLHAFRPTKAPAAISLRKVRVKGRFIPETDLSSLLHALMSGRQTQERWGTKTIAWLNAGIASGARPGEWEDAHWLERDVGILRLPNLKLKKHVPFVKDWLRVPRRLLTEAGASLEAMAEAEGDDDAMREFRQRRELLEEDRTPRAVERSVERSAFYERAIAGATDAQTIESLIRLRAWELRNGELAWRDIVVAPGWRGDVQSHMAQIGIYCDQGPEHTFERYYDNCRRSMRVASLLAFPDGRLYSLYDARSTAAANLRAVTSVSEAAQTMGHYAGNNGRILRKNYAGAAYAFGRSGRYAPRMAATENQVNFQALSEFSRQAQGTSPDAPVTGGGPPVDGDGAIEGPSM